MTRTHPRRLRRIVVGSAAAALIAGGAPAVFGGAVANAAPGETDVNGVHMTSGHATGDQSFEIDVYSPSMQRSIPLKVLAPADRSKPAPVVYVLNGAGGGEDSANWTDQSDIDSFFADKNAYVVIPQEGAFSYYTDWQRKDPALAENLGNNGINKWGTFLTEELPPFMDAYLGQDSAGTNGKTGLMGISSSGTSVLNLAIRAPELYDAVGAFSGCAMTSDPAGQAFVDAVTAAGGADAANMWGPRGGPGWVEHDPYVNADQLPDVPMYIASGSGGAGVHDNLNDPRIDGNVGTLAGQLITGGVIEAVTGTCTTLLQQKTDAMGMDNIQYHFEPGTHSWGYWQDDLHDSWPMFVQALNVPQ